MMKRESSSHLLTRWDKRGESQGYLDKLGCYMAKDELADKSPTRAHGNVVRMDVPIFPRPHWLV